MQDIQDAVGLVTIQDRIDNQDIGGFVTVEVIRDTPDGPRVMARRVSHNLVVNVGKKALWRIASGLSAKTFDQGRIGTSAAAAGSADANVLSPVTGTLQTVDSKSLLDATRTHKWVWSYPSGAGSKSATDISEAVIMNANTSPGGSSLMRATFTPVTKTTADKLRISYSSRIT